MLGERVTWTDKRNGGCGGCSAQVHGVEFVKKTVEVHIERPGEDSWAGMSWDEWEAFKKDPR